MSIVSKYSGETTSQSESNRPSLRGAVRAGNAQAAEAEAAALQRNHARVRDRLDAGDRLQPLAEPSRQFHRLLFAITGERHIDAGDLDVRRLESRIGVRRFLERSQEQQRRHDQHQRQRDLRGDQRVAQPESLAIGGGIRAVQHRREVGAERVPRRRQSEDHAGDERDAECEQPCTRMFTPKSRLRTTGSAGSDPPSSDTSQ